MTTITISTPPISPVSSAKIKRTKQLSILGTVLTLTAFAISANIIPPLITTIATEIQSDYNHFGYIIMLQFFSFFLAGTSGGWLAEQFNLNSRKLVSLGLFIIFVTLLGGSWLKSLHHFIIWVIPLGFGGGLIETFGSVMISNHEKPNSSKLLNLSQVFYCLGAIAAPQIVSVFLYIKLSWQIIFIFFSTFILLILCLFVAMTRRETQLGITLEFKKIPERPLLKDRMFYFLASILLIYVTFESILACWIPVYFEKGLSCSAHTSALRISVFWFGLILGRLTTAIVPARFSLWPAMFFGAGLMCISSFLASLSTIPSIVTTFVFLIGIGAGPLWPTTVAICRVIRNRQRFTSAIIAIGAIGVIIGSFQGGFILKYMGFNFFFPIITFGSILLLLMSFTSKFYSNKIEKFTSDNDSDRMAKSTSTEFN